jgi:hypothetical protein
MHHSGPGEMELISLIEDANTMPTVEDYALSGLTFFGYISGFVMEEDCDFLRSLIRGSHATRKAWPIE